VTARPPTGSHAPSIFSFAGAAAQLDLAGAGSGRAWGNVEGREQAGVRMRRCPCSPALPR
jgi:hypothetical protein